MDQVVFGDCRVTLKHWVAQGIRVQMCVTSPPYFHQRDYNHTDQLGQEATPSEYVACLVNVFRSVRELLKEDGTLWLNIGDSYATKAYPNGVKTKDLLGIPWLLAFALRDDGWYLRQDIIWSKKNPMPESAIDRCTRAHEYLFLLTKSKKYFFNGEAIMVDGVGSHSRGNAAHVIPNRNDQGAGHRSGVWGGRPDGKRHRWSVWEMATGTYAGVHFATFPPALVEPCILAGSRVGDIVLDPFMGSGTTAIVALDLQRHYLGCELNKDYERLQLNRLATRENICKVPPQTARHRSRKKTKCSHSQRAVPPAPTFDGRLVNNVTTQPLNKVALTFCGDQRLSIN
jgi:DNA modification methylase